MRKKYLISLLGLSLFLPPLVQADTLAADANYTVCFTPGGNCKQQIIDALDGAVANVWVQAYSFTSRPIARALVDAEERGVHVAIIVDKDMLTHQASMLWGFAHAGIPVWVDNQVAIAHNKVMIIDQTRVITGSYNFTYSAQERNAENLLIIDDGGLAKKYLQNWQQRQAVSRPFVLSAETPAAPNWLESLWQAFLQWLQHLFLRSDQTAV